MRKMSKESKCGVLDSYFMISQRGSTIPTEILGGVVTFMAMAYILVVHPSIMTAGGKGMPREAVFVATAVIAGISTICMGLYAKLPFALATGMGSNALLAALIMNESITWQAGIGMVAVSGTIFMLTSFPLFKPLALFGCRDPKILDFSLREFVVQAIPLSVKFGVGFCIGLQLMILGLGGSGIGFGLVAGNRFTMGSLANPAISLGLAGMVFILAGAHMRGKNGKALIPGAYLIGMLLITAIAIMTGLSPSPKTLVTTPPSMQPVLMAFDLRGAIRIENWPYILAFFMSDFFSTLGTSISCAQKANLLKDGTFPGINQVFQVDSLFTVLGAFCGLTVVTTFVESNAGVESGARTGFASIITGVLFLLALFLSPIFLMIPKIATGAALVGVGVGMMMVIERIVGQVKDDPVELVSVLIMIGSYAVFRNTATAMCSGIVVNTLLKCIRLTYDRPQKIDPIKLASAIVLTAMGVAYFAVQMMAA